RGAPRRPSSRRSGYDGEQVLAHLRHVGGDLRGGALADRHHGADGGDADDDAQGRQERAHRIPTYLAQRHQRRAPEHQRLPSACSASMTLACLVSLSTRPSRNRIVRRPYAAMSSSWVTMTTVIPRERFSSTRRRMIS